MVRVLSWIIWLWFVILPDRVALFLLDVFIPDWVERARQAVDSQRQK